MASNGLVYKEKNTGGAMPPVSFRRRLKSAFYFGLNKACPICKSSLRSFKPFGLKHAVLNDELVVGGGYRQDALCPVCGSVDRERLVYLYLQHKTNVFKSPIKLLHLAPEDRLAVIFERQANLDYLTADLYSNKVMVKMDVRDIHFPDNSFDAIICNHVLEHVDDDKKAMSELCRVLKPGGWAILQVPISLARESTYEDFSITTDAGRAVAFGQEDHVRIYARDYREKLESVGFQVEVFMWPNEAENFGGTSNKFGLNEKEGLYRAVKPL